MRLEALHHITMITGDARRNVEFYAGTLGLRLVKKTVNFDQPHAYHLYFGDEQGSPGSILTWFEFPGAARGRAGAGAIHLIQLAVGSEAALDFWAQRLHAPARPSGGSLRFEDYDGLAFELLVAPDQRPPLRAEHPEIPPEHAITGVWGARAFAPADAPDGEEPFLTQMLGFTHVGADEYRLDGEQRTIHWAYDRPPAAPAIQGAGSVHHIAWASQDGDHLAWQQRVRESGTFVTDVRDRDYFRSIYFGEPRGVLFEIATLSPGFAVDEDPAHLGEALRLPAQHEHLRAHLEHTLAPIPQPAGVTGLLIHERPADGEPDGLLVLHHGRGADGRDLLGLAPLLDPQRRLHVVTPQAPLVLPGLPGYHWYLVPRVGHPDPASFAAAVDALGALHDELWERTGLGPAQTVLGGFSMGSVMSYAVGLSGGRPAPAGILAFSGFIPTVEGWAPSLADRQALRVFISHGSLDPVISVEFARSARERLTAGGLDVEYREFDGAHEVVGVRAAAAWITQTLGPA